MLTFGEFADDKVPETQALGVGLDLAKDGSLEVLVLAVTERRIFTLSAEQTAELRAFLDSNGVIMHEFKRGETLRTVAKRYNVSEVALYKENRERIVEAQKSIWAGSRHTSWRIGNMNFIIPGTALQIPEGGRRRLP